MNRISTVQNSHTYGVIDPHATERRDTKFMQASLSDGANIILLPQGGYRDRGGSEDYGRGRRALNEVHTAAISATTGTASWPYVTSDIDLGSVQAIDAVDLAGFYASSGNSSEGTLTIQYYDGAAWQDYGSVDLSTISNTRRFAFAPGTASIDAQLWRVEVDGYTDSRDLTFGQISFQNETASLVTVITKNFSFNASRQYQLNLSAGNIDIYKSGIWQAACPLPIADEYIREVKLAAKYATVLFFHQTMQSLKLVRQGADDQWLSEFIDFDNLPDYDFGDGDEPVISATRGWPAVGIFVDERLVLMGFPEIPNGFMPSVLGSPFDFDTTIVGVTRAFLYEVNTGDASIINIIDAIYTRTLILFGSRQLAYLNSATLSPDVAPDFRASDAPGLKSDVTPIRADSRILYVQQGGQTVNLMNYSELEQNFNADNASVLSAQQINNPVDVTLRRSVSSVDSDVIFIVMGDGTMSALTLMRSQDVSGYAPQNTEGYFRSMDTDIDQNVWLTVERDNQGASEYRFEKLNPDGFLDSCINQVHDPASDTITGLERFNDKEIWVIGDNQPYGPFTVSGGEVVLDESVAASCAGFWPVPTATDHAVDLEAEQQAPMPDKKRVFEVEVSLLNTHSLAIGANGQAAADVPLFRFDEIEFDQAVLDRPFTGRLEVQGMPGFTKEAKVTLTQAFPGRLIMRQLTKRIAT